MVWDGDENCRHEWGNITTPARKKTAPSNSVNKNGFKDAFRNSERYVDHVADETQASGQFCQHCNAWRGSLGLEPDPNLFIEHIVQVFREVRRVLRKDGTVWLNFGDSYINHSIPGGGDPTIGKRNVGDSKYTPTKAPGLKPKDLIGIPWRVALALQADVWYLRSDIIWAKPNPMPESVTDRPTKAHEYLFLLSKSPKYFYDADAIREPHQPDGRKITVTTIGQGVHENHHGSAGHERWPNSGRNKRTVWTIATQPQPAAHFATFPEKLIEPCILAGTSEKGCCVECGAPRERVAEKKFIPQPDIKNPDKLKRGGGKGLDESSGWSESQRGLVESKTLGWKPTCRCIRWEQDRYTNGSYARSVSETIPKTKPCTVLDPFFGSGTTGIVAHKHGRNFIGIELSESYLEDIAIPRIEKATKQRKLFK